MPLTSTSGVFRSKKSSAGKAIFSAVYIVHINCVYCSSQSSSMVKQLTYKVYEAGCIRCNTFVTAMLRNVYILTVR